MTIQVISGRPVLMLTPVTDVTLCIVFTVFLAILFVMSSASFIIGCYDSNCPITLFGSSRLVRFLQFWPAYAFGRWLLEDA
jgi:hypothetical protein